MKKIFMALVLFLFVGLVFGTAIHLKDSKILYGHIRGRTDNHIILYDYTIDTFVKIEISKIESIFAADESDITDKTLNMTNFDNNIDYSNLYNINSINFQQKIKSKQESLWYKEYDFNFRSGLISIPLFALSWYFFQEAYHIKKTIKDWNDLDLPTSGLKKERNRKDVMGVICGLSGFINFVLSFEKVEIQASPTSVSLGYRF